MLLVKPGMLVRLCGSSSTIPFWKSANPMNCDSHRLIVNGELFMVIASPTKNEVFQVIDSAGVVGFLPEGWDWTNVKI